MTLLLRNHCFQQVLIAPLMMAALERVYRELIDGDAVRDCLGLITGLILFGLWFTSLLILLAFFAVSPHVGLGMVLHKDFPF